ncbi:MAG TPA: hypothetical protein VGK67_11160 [Myxococcales bacterium]|jgi:hypothetical protein
MSCPKCGSGAVFQGKCRECGTVVDPRRASSVAVRPPSLADEDFGEETIAEARARRPDPESTIAPPGRRAAPALASMEDEDPDRTRMPPAVRKGSSVGAPADPPPAPPPARPARASQQSPARAPKPAVFEPDEPLKPMEMKDRSSWYKEAGLKPPSKQQLAEPGEENSVSITAPSPIGGYTAPAAVLFAQAAAGMLGVLFGLSPIGLIAGGVALIAAILLLKGVGAGKFVGWLAVGIFIAWGGALAVSFKQPVLAALTLVPTACLVGALLIEARPVRSALGGIGVAIALVGVVVPALSARRSGAGADSSTDGLDTTAYQEGATGISVRMPPSVSVFSRPKDIAANLPEPWRSLGLKLGFATGDDGFVGGLLQSSQPPGAELRNLLAPLSEGSTAPPRKNDRLVPDGLSELETQGWEVSTRAGDLMVVLTKAPDGRAFTLFGVAGTAKGRNAQLFKAIADSFQVKKHLRAE